MPEGVQRYQRTKMVLPLRVWTDEHEHEVAALQLAHTLDISPIGGRIGGLRTPVEPGQTLTVQRGQQKTQVRVIWSKQLAPTEVQAGFETLEFGKRIWDVDLPQQAQALRDARAQQQAEAKLEQERLEEQRASLDEGSVIEISGEPDWTQDEPRQQNWSGQEEAIQETEPVAASQEQYQATVAAMPDPASQPAARVRHMPIAPPAVQMRWVGIAAGLILLSSIGVFTQYKLSDGSGVAEIQAPAPKPPTDDELAAMTPKPRKILPLVAAATPDADTTRLKVAEAPQGHMVYPVAPSAEIKGKVDLKVVIATDGRVKQIQLRSGKQLLAQAAEQAIKLWRYSKHAIDGEPVEAETTVTVSFLGDDAVSLHFPQSNLVRN